MKLTIFFDWDGTIADSMELCLAEVAEALRAVEHPPVTEAELRACNGPTPAESVHFFDLEGQRAEQYLQARHDAQLRLIPVKLTLFDGIREGLLKLKDRASLHIVSNGLLDYILCSVKVSGLEGVFDSIEAGRPELTKGQLLGEMLGKVRPERAILVGDRAGDIQAALENRLPAVAVRYGYGTEEEFAGADRIVDDVDSLLALLMAWTENGAL
ncbi:MAG: HAD family hydrolase [Clostridia bacterium]|nr:HAD family hydrolase [Clostridia bacterium]